MTAVGRDLNIPVRFGDFRTVYTVEREKQRQEEERRRIVRQPLQALLPPDDSQVDRTDDSQAGRKGPSTDPDYAAVNDENRVRFVGEIKTPWTQDLATARSINNRWRKWIGKCVFTHKLFCPMGSNRLLGQIANYMKAYHLKYGFWTTYEQTVFLKQEESQGRWFLRVSDVIKYNTKSDLKRGADDNLTNRVSLRECMLFLICQTNGRGSDIYVHNDDEHFIEENRKSKPAEDDVRTKMSQKGTRVIGPSAKEIEARKKAESGQQSLLRGERATRRGTKIQIPGPTLEPLREASGEPARRQPIVSSLLQTVDPRASEHESSNRSSSASSKQRTTQTRAQKVPDSRPFSAERGHCPSRPDPFNEAGLGEATPKALSASKTQAPSAVAQRKQEATATSSSRERRAQSAGPSRLRAWWSRQTAGPRNGRKLRSVRGIWR